MRLAVVGVVALVACGERVPEYVYVPAPDYTQSLTIAIMPGEPAPRVGVPVSLLASSTMGPWQRVRSNSANLDKCWTAGTPREVETAAAASIRWIVTPSDSVFFNFSGPLDTIRTVRFPRPGVYRLWGQSFGCPQHLFSDTLTITVK